MGKQGRISADEPRKPISSTRRARAQPLVLVAAPADQVGINLPRGSQQCRPVEVTIVVDPASDVGIEHPCQIIEGLVTSPMEGPSTYRLPDRFQRFRACGGQERNAELPSVPDRLSRPKFIAEEVKRLDRIVSSAVRILAILALFTASQFVNFASDPY